jgi:hypothetical protein
MLFLRNVKRVKLDLVFPTNRIYLEIDDYQCHYKGPLQDVNLLNLVLQGFLSNDEKVLNFDIYDR